MREVVYRKPRMSDAGRLRDHFNGLIAEDTFILACGGPVTLAAERKWLSDSLSSIRKGGSCCIVAECGGRIIGFASLRRQGASFFRTRSEHVAEFGISISDPSMRGKGIGETLARKVLSRAKKMKLRMVVLDVFANNPVARGLYKKLGFRECGRIPGGVRYKGRYVDRIMMFKRL